MSKLNNLGEARNLRIKPDARVLWRDATSSLDSRSLHNEQTRPTSNDSANMRGSVPRLLEAIETRILAEGRDENAILEGHTTDCEGREELWDGGSVGLRVDGASCWRILSWREEWDTLSRLQICRGLIGALARRHDRLCDWHHNLLRVWHCGSCCSVEVQNSNTKIAERQRKSTEAVYMSNFYCAAYNSRSE